MLTRAFAWPGSRPRPSIRPRASSTLSGLPLRPIGSSESEPRSRLTVGTGRIGDQVVRESEVHTLVGGRSDSCPNARTRRDDNWIVVPVTVLA